MIFIIIRCHSTHSWLILTACQPVKGYFKVRNNEIASNEYYSVHSPVECELFLNGSTKLIDGALTATTTLGQNEPESNGNEEH